MIKMLIDKIKSNPDDVYTQIQCFSQIARNVGNRISKEQIAEIFPLLNNQVRKVLDSSQSHDTTNELAEAGLYAIESLSKKAPREIDAFINQILQLAQTAVVFDPNYNYDFGDGDDQGFDDEEGGWPGFEDEEMAPDDDDDTSWKVRRAAVKLIEAITNSRPEMLREVYKVYARLLAERFKERDENVKCNILETFRVLLKSAVLSEIHQGIEHQL